MGLFGDVFGGSTSSSGDQTETIDITETTKSKRDLEEKQEQVRNTASQEQASQQTEQTQRRELLDAATQELFRNLIGRLSPQVGAEGTQGGTEEAMAASRALNERAAGAEEAIRADTKAIVGEARRQGENKIEQIITQAAQGAGSSLNTLVASLGSREVGDLETRLGALEGQLNIEARGAETGERVAGIESLIKSSETGAGVGQSATGQIAQLGTLLRGATEEVTTVGETLAQTEAEEIETAEGLRTLVELIDSVVRREGTISTSGSSDTSSSPGLLDFISVF